MSELSRETDALLERGRDGESLAPHDRARLKRALLAQIAGVSVVATTSTAAAWTTVAAKVVGVAVIVGSVGLGVAAILPSRPPAMPRNSSRDTSAVASSPTKGAIPAVMSGAVYVPLPAPPALSPPPSRSAVSASNEARAYPRTPGGEPEVRAPLPPAASASSSLEEEARLLRDADDALKAGEPERALRVLEELTARFPESALAPERAAERVFALCMAGRQDDARSAAGAFLRTQDIGPLAARVRASCGGDPKRGH